MPSNYSLFKNASARSARIDKQSGVQGDRPTFRRSSLAGSAAREMRLADEERKRRNLESEAPGAGEKAERSLKSEKQVSMGLRAGGGVAFERATKPDPQPDPMAQPAVPAAPPAPPEEKNESGGVFSKLFSLFGGRK